PTRTLTGNPPPAYTFQCNCFYPPCNHRPALPSSPTRRSSDLAADAGTTLTVTITATNTAGTANADSTATAVVSAATSAPVNTAIPDVHTHALHSPGLHASPRPRTGNPTPTYTYQWKRCDTTGN